MKKQVPGFYLWLNLVIAIVYDFGIQGIALIFYLAGFGTAGASAAIGLALSKGVYIFTIFLTYLFRYFHNSKELEPYANEREAEVKALRKRANKLQQINAQLARKGADVQVILDQQLDKIKNIILRAVIRKIWIYVIELLPIIGAISPTFTIGALYDLRELGNERKSFEPVNTEIETLKNQVKGGEQIAKRARENTDTSSTEGVGRQIQKARNKAQQANKNKQTQSSQSRSTSSRIRTSA